MEINIGSKRIISTVFSNTETAWKIEDAIGVLEYLKGENKVILGGDILTEKLEHNYDSWYYNVEADRNARFNIECSNKLACEYISSYIRTNGNAFYVIFVTQDRGRFA